MVSDRVKALAALAGVLIVAMFISSLGGPPDVMDTGVRGRPLVEGAPPQAPAPATVPGRDAAVALVRSAVRSGVSIDPLRVGALNDGVAILTSGDGAFWVSGGRAYAANGTAKTWAPSLDYAPTGIDFFTVREVVQ